MWTRIWNLSDPTSNVIVPLDSLCMVSYFAFKNNMWPNSAPFLDISPQNLNDIDFDLSKPLKIKSNGAVGYDFLLVSPNPHLPAYHLSHFNSLAVTTTRHFFSYVLSASQNFRPECIAGLRNIITWMIEKCLNHLDNGTPLIILALLDYVSRAHEIEIRASSVCCIDYLWSYCMDFFQILVVASPGPYMPRRFCFFFHFWQKKLHFLRIIFVFVNMGPNGS